MLTHCRHIAIGLVLAAVAVSTGCGRTTKSSYTLDVPPVGRAMAVDIENFRGSVVVRAEPWRTEILVESDIHVDSDTPIEDRDALTAAVRVDARIDESEGGNILRIRTVSDMAERDDHWVNLRVFAPSVDGVRIDNRGSLKGGLLDGHVMCVNVAGAQTITNRYGAIEIRTSRPINEPVTLTTVDGDIYYSIPPGSSGRFDLETLDGIAGFRNLGSDTDETYSSLKTVYTLLNNGDSPVVARTNKGYIYVRVRDDAVEWVRTFKHTLPDPRNALQLQTGRRFTRNLPDDAPSEHSSALEIYD